MQGGFTCRLLGASIGILMLCFLRLGLLRGGLREGAPVEFHDMASQVLDEQAERRKERGEFCSSRLAGRELRVQPHVCDKPSAEDLDVHWLDTNDRTCITST